MSRSRLPAFLLIVYVVAFPGCGGNDDSAADAPSAEKRAVLEAIDNFYIAFTHAKPASACALMTPTLRKQFLQAVGDAVPSLRGKPCRHAYLAFYKRVPPENAPRAITLASSPDYPAVEIAGDTAIASYKEGGKIRLRRSGGKWLIAAAELLPSASVGERR